MNEQMSRFGVCQARRRLHFDLQFTCGLKDRPMQIHHQCEHICACVCVCVFWGKLSRIQTLHSEHSGRPTVEERSVDGVCPVAKIYLQTLNLAIYLHATTHMLIQLHLHFRGLRTSCPSSHHDTYNGSWMGKKNPQSHWLMSGAD